MPPFPFEHLLQWYEQHGRHHLPWRDYHYDTKQLWYRIWLAETMLQQTQADRVQEYFQRILEAFPSVEALAATDYETFFPYYKWLGYYSRARNMLKTAKMVVEKFDGIFPQDTKDLIQLPGVWPYTAEAIRAFAYNIPTLSFDTNLEKIFSRYYFGNKFRRLTREEKEGLLKQMKHVYTSHKTSLLNPLPSKVKGTTVSSSPQKEELKWGLSQNINNALMDYGAMISRNNISWIDWDNYPFKDSKFCQTRGSLEPVKKKKKSSFPGKQAYVIAILHENHKKYFSRHTPPVASDIPLDEGEKYTTSLNKENDFSPFFIGKNTGNPRAMIQEYFREKYWLELSVRPPEVRSYNRHEVPYLVCYAQIQSWTHNFQVFKNIKVRGFEENLVEKLEF